MKNIVKRNVIFVAGLHGTEQMPVRALTDAGIGFILGNPKACEEKVRFTERDINASFGLDAESYESRRAEEILKEVDEADLVVDFHSTEAEVEPFVIVVDKDMIPFAKTTGVKRIVFMSHSIKEGHALINYRDGVSVEVGLHEGENSYAETLKIVASIERGAEHEAALYEVFGPITEPGDYINFQDHADGFIPILANESVYEKEGLFGLKARAM